MKLDLIEKFRAVDDRNLRQAKEELAESYRQISGTIAFKDIMNHIQKIAMDTFKQEDICELSVLAVTAAESRGIRKGMDQLKRRIENATNAQ